MMKRKVEYQKLHFAIDQMTRQVSGTSFYCDKDCAKMARATLDYLYQKTDIESVKILPDQDGIVLTYNKDDNKHFIGIYVDDMNHSTIFKDTMKCIETNFGEV